MAYLLNFLYLMLLLLVSPWLLWQAIRKGKYREGYAAKFFGLVLRRDSRQPCLWLHAVSVGEVNLLASLLREIQARRPEWECVISTTTMTGMALAKKKYPHLTSFYCPLDFSWAVRTAIERIRPGVLVLAELELWPNLVRAARESGAQVAVINGRLSEHSFRGYRRIRPLVARVLRQIDLIAAQDPTYADRFRRLGARPDSVCVTGSMKYDGAETDRANPATQRLRQLAGFDPSDVVFLAGSTQEPEEEAALAVFQELAPSWPQLRLVLVPRHPDRFDAVANLLEQSGLAWQRRTALSVGQVANLPPSPLSPLLSPLVDCNRQVGNLPHEGPVRPRVLLVDAVGELGAWWGTAQIAFVGGSLGNRGGQNMIEPAAYGAAVCFGPNTRNFRDIVAAMLACEAAVVVRDPCDLRAFVRHCLEDPHFAESLGERAKALVASQLGATRRTFELLAGLPALLAAGEAEREAA